MESDEADEEKKLNGPAAITLLYVFGRGCRAPLHAPFSPLLFDPVPSSIPQAAPAFPAGFHPTLPLSTSDSANHAPVSQPKLPITAAENLEIALLGRLTVCTGILHGSVDPLSYVFLTHSLTRPFLFPHSPVLICHPPRIMDANQPPNDHLRIFSYNFLNFNNNIKIKNLKL